MKLLLDTHVFLWWMSGHKSLTAKVVSAINEGKNVVFVSAVTAWEISIKKALGMLKAPDELVEALDANRFLQLPITIQHGLLAGDLPRHHDAPFDRMLIAQAQLEHLTIISHDVQMKRYGIPILWA